MILFETTLGNITLELFETDAPGTSANFKQYVEDGFYDGTIFHRVIDEFMIQGGGFELVLTGHSLGAGTAALLTLLLYHLRTLPAKVASARRTARIACCVAPCWAAKLLPLPNHNRTTDIIISQVYLLLLINIMS